MKYFDTRFERTWKEANIPVPRNPSKMSVSEVKSIIAKKDGSVPRLFSSNPGLFPFQPQSGMGDHNLLGDVWLLLPFMSR